MSVGSDKENCAVKIAVRERPARDLLKDGSGRSVVGYHPCSNILIVDERPFTFDHVFGPTISQSQVFDDLIQPLVGYFNLGFNCTALAYGQTGTGKSYTMGLDLNKMEGEHIGVIPRCLNELFSDGKHFGTEDVTANGQAKLRELSVSFIEIYNEKVYDLLAENSTVPIVAKGYRYTGGIRKSLTNLQDCQSILTQGNKNRHVRPTKMNSLSSRSHAVFTMHLRQITSNTCGEESVVYSCMNIVDLAGSEGVRRTGHQGVAMSEGVNINQGLLSIGKVLQAMTVGSKVIPYRDSVLSSVLQDSLNANSYLTLLACISPHREDLSETLTTLRFAQNAKQLKNTPQINNIIANIKKNTKHKQTPFKVKPLQSRSVNKASSFKRTLSSQPVVPLKTPIKSNTFCTPKKQRIEVNKCNQTDIIGNHQPSVRKISNIGMNLPKMDQLNSTNNRESLNRSLELNSSLSSLNISSSTAVDCVANNKNPNSNNFSPIIRKCLTELETGLEKKFVDILQRNMHTFAVQHTPSYALPPQSALFSSMRSEMKTIMREILAESSLATSDTPVQLDAKCELFKIPTAPKMHLAPNTTVDKSGQNVSMRRSRRISQRFMTDNQTEENSNLSSNSICRESFIDKTRRRSKRISQCFAAENMAKVNGSPHSYTIVNSTVRKSSRRSVLQKDQYLKRKQCQLSCCSSPIASQKSHQQNSKKMKSMNTIMENCYGGTSLTKHRKAILDLLNNGSRKDVQILPMIGQKRAFQIITHRTLHGKFKNMAQVENLPLWRGTEWSRFAEANLLV